MRRAVIFEEHSSVLPHWFSAGVANADLVCLDAHLDLQFVDEARIARLRACTSADELRRLESPHPSSPDRSCCFGIEDFLLPAVRLGMLRRVIWVAPPRVRGVAASALGALQQMEGVTVEDLESFRRMPGGWLHGRLLGVELLICELPQLPLLRLAEPVLLDIDIDYFVNVPEDTLWVDPKVVVEWLEGLPRARPELTISRSVGSGFMPLQYRGIADQFGALWEQRRADAGQWHHAPEAGNPAGQGSADDIVRRISEFRARSKSVDLATLSALRREVEASGAGDGPLAIAWISLGLLYAAAGRVDEAAHCDAQSMKQSGGHPSLALEIANLCMAQGDLGGAEPLLQRAARDDETRVIARLQLAEIAFARGDCVEAARQAQAAHEAAPAWPHLLKRLATFTQAGPDATAAARWAHEHDELCGRLDAVASRLLG
jgi:hypothetical protein